MNETTNQILGINLMPEGIELVYARFPQDVRKNGLMWKHSVLVPRDSDYDDEIGAVEEALAHLLTDVLEDEGLAEPVELADPDEEDEDED